MAISMCHSVLDNHFVVDVKPVNCILYTGQMVVITETEKELQMKMQALNNII